MQPVGQLARSPQRMGPFGEEARHLGRGFQVPLGIGGDQRAGLGEGDLFADTGHHVLQGTAGSGMVEHVIGCQKPQPRLPRQPIKPGDPRPIIAAVKMARCQIAKPRQTARQTR